MKKKLFVHIYEVHYVPVEVEVDDTPNLLEDALDKAQEMLDNGEVNEDHLEYSYRLPKVQWGIYLKK